MEGFIPAEKEILNDIMDVLPLLYDLFDEDVSFSVTDDKKYLMNHGVGEMNIDTPLETPIDPNSGIARCMKIKAPAQKQIPKDLYGFAFKAYNVPIIEDGMVIGTMNMGKSLSASTRFAETCETLTERINQIQAVTKEMADTLTEMVEKNSSIMEITDKTVSAAKSTEDVLSFIQNISTQTRLLGLNASIEAARAGEAGKGFAVVAQEIEKMSSSTTESVKKSAGQLEMLTTASKNVQKQVKQSNDAFEDQTGKIQEILSSIESICGEMDKLNELAKTL